MAPEQRELTPDDYAHAAARLQIDVPAMRAIAEVESPRGPFENDGSPCILFERHKFHEFTQGRYDQVAPDLSAPTAGGYGLYSAQHGRLDRAIKLGDTTRDAALMATSWGQFQLMGFNWRACGFASLQAFINAMYRSAPAQLAAFCGFIESDERLQSALRHHDWPTVAKLYNGPAYARNKYDTKLAAAFKRWGGKA